MQSHASASAFTSSHSGQTHCGPLASGVPAPPCCFFAWRGKAEISAHPWDLGSSASSSSSLAAVEVIAPRHLLHRLWAHSLLPQRYQQVPRRLFKPLHSRSPPEYQDRVVPPETSP